MLHCHAGCEPAAVSAALGLSLADLMPPRAATAASRKLTIGSPGSSPAMTTATKPGNVLFQVVRYEPKDFRQRRPKPGGGWDWSVKGVRMVPYRLPRTAGRADAGCRGGRRRKGCGQPGSISVLATCNAGGAGKWTAEHAAVSFAGRHVIVLRDNDESGRKHAQ